MGFCVGLCFRMRYFYDLCSFAIMLTRERVGCFGLIVFRMSCHCKCFVALPHGAVGLSAVCDCGIS